MDWIPPVPKALVRTSLALRKTFMNAWRSSHTFYYNTPPARLQPFLEKTSGSHTFYWIFAILRRLCGKWCCNFAALCCLAGEWRTGFP
ncbi:hypothetical protein [Ruminococcus sp.]